MVSLPALYGLAMALMVCVPILVIWRDKKSEDKAIDKARLENDELRKLGREVHALRQHYATLKSLSPRMRAAKFRVKAREVINTASRSNAYYLNQARRKYENEFIKG